MALIRHTHSTPGFPVGIKALHSPEGATVDICFVHGIMGDREKTWTAAGQSEPWPKKLLPPILPQARILTFGYDAYFVSKHDVSTNGLDQHALSLTNDLFNNRRQANACGRPLIFVAHGLGGIVCKEAILKSKCPPPKGSHLKDIYDSLAAIAFLGTPHRGTWNERWATVSVSATPEFFIGSANVKLLEVLKVGNELNERTHAYFAGALDERQRDKKPVQVTCFSEELPMKPGGIIVERASASLDIGISLTIRANHRDMVRFASSGDTGFLRLCGELERWVEGCEHRTAQDEMRVQMPLAQEIRDKKFAFHR